MISKGSFSPSRPIGRDFQFADPLQNSNKKHFWALGQGNIGFLTSQQVETLKKLKQKEKKMNLIHHKKSIYQNVIASSPALRIQKNDVDHDHGYHHSYMEHPSYQSTLLSKVENHKSKQGRSKRLLFKRNEEKFQEQKQSAREQEILNQQKRKLHQRNQTELDSADRQKYFKQARNKRIKTLDIQRSANPQEADFELLKETNNKFQSHQNSIDKGRERRKIKIQSGSINVQLPSQNLSHNFHLKDETSQLNQFLIDHSMKSKIQSELTEQSSDALYKGKKFLQTKVYARNKFRRDYSPTFCNSFGYPLRYYRHV